MQFRLIEWRPLRSLHVDPEFIRDLFAQFRPVTVRPMFSGAGIFADGLMFGLIVDGAIHLKVDETNIADFERESSRPFTYTRGKGSSRPTHHALPYWRLPERLYDDPDELAIWAERAFAVAERKKLAPRKRAKRNPSAKRK
jgi:DNA transformation protein and related proteins